MKEKYRRPLLGAANSALYLTAVYSVLFIKNINVARITGIVVLSALVLLAIATLFVYKIKKPYYYSKTPAHCNHSLIAAFSILLCCTLIPEFNVLPQNRTYADILLILLYLGSTLLDAYLNGNEPRKVTINKLFIISQYILLIPLYLPLSLHINPYVIAGMTILLIATTIGEFLTVYNGLTTKYQQNATPRSADLPAQHSEGIQTNTARKQNTGTPEDRTLNLKKS